MWFRKEVRILTIPHNIHLHVDTFLVWIRSSDAFGIGTLALQNLYIVCLLFLLLLVSICFSFWFYLLSAVYCVFLAMTSIGREDWSCMLIIICIIITVVIIVLIINTNVFIITIIVSSIVVSYYYACLHRHWLPVQRF